MVREARREDLNEILELYLFLREKDVPENISMSYFMRR